jgi:hypothetical protein
MKSRCTGLGGLNSSGSLDEEFLKLTEELGVVNMFC